MHRHLSPVLKKIIGSILVVLGVVGAFIPIPIVPFFLLIFIGLAMLGIKHPWIDKMKKMYERERAKERSLAVRIGALLIGILLFFLIICVSVFFYVQIIGRGDMYKKISDVPQTNIAIILGASVIDGKPSLILEERAKATIELYMVGKVSKILVTGDNRESNYDEVTPVRTYLERAGVPTEAILFDRLGFDTYSSLHRAQNIFGATSTVIITQSFHLPRALFIARHLGIDSDGFVADGGKNPMSGYIREIPATIKALLDLIVRRQPESI